MSGDGEAQVEEKAHLRAREPGLPTRGKGRSPRRLTREDRWRGPSGVAAARAMAAGPVQHDLIKRAGPGQKAGPGRRWLARSKRRAREMARTRGGPPERPDTLRLPWPSVQA